MTVRYGGRDEQIKCTVIQFVMYWYIKCNTQVFFNLQYEHYIYMYTAFSTWNLQNNVKVEMETRNVHINNNRIKISSYTPWTWVIIFSQVSTTVTIRDTNITFGFMSYSCTFRLVVGNLIEYPFEAFQIVMFLLKF